MAAEATGTKPRPEKFRAHGIQSDWLNQAQDKSVEVALDGGQVLNGRLVGHDIYCIALDEAGEEGNTLIYKQSISFVRVSKDQI